MVGKLQLKHKYEVDACLLSRKLILPTINIVLAARSKDCSWKAKGS